MINAFYDLHRQVLLCKITLTHFMLEFVGSNSISTLPTEIGLLTRLNQFKFRK